VTYSYFADPMYVFMDSEFNQYDVEKDNLADALNYLEEGLACELTFYEGRAISVELPTSSIARSRTPSPRSRATRRAR
jgi:elongation factor P